MLDKNLILVRNVTNSKRKTPISIFLTSNRLLFDF